MNVATQRFARARLLTTGRRRLAAVVSASALAFGGLTGAASAAVESPSGASADTVLVCMRVQGAYAIGTQSSGFHYLRTYAYNGYTGEGLWSRWDSPAVLANKGFGLPTRGPLAMYVEYAYWNGIDWEIVGEWGKVLNTRGEHVSWFC